MPSGSGNTIKCQMCGKLGHGAQKFFQLCYFLLGKAGVASAFMEDTPKSSSTFETTQWLLDSGATHYHTIDAVNLHTSVHYTGHDSVTVGNVSFLSTKHYLGVSTMIVNDHGFHLHQVLYIPMSF